MPLPFTTSSLTSSLRSTIANNQPSLLNNIEKLSSQASSFAQKTGVFGPLHTQPSSNSNNNTNSQPAQQQQSQQKDAPQNRGNSASNTSFSSNMINRTNFGNSSTNNSNQQQQQQQQQQQRGNTNQGPATSGVGAGQNGPPVDLSHLTAEERAMIQSVMAKAEMVEIGLPVDTSLPSSTNLPSQTSQALTMQRQQQNQQQQPMPQYQTQMNSMSPFNSSNQTMMMSSTSPNMQPNAQQSQLMMNNMGQQQQQQQPMGLQIANSMPGPLANQQASGMMGPTAYNQISNSQQQPQQQNQQAFQQATQSFSSNQQQAQQQQQPSQMGSSNTNQLATLERQTQQLVGQINSQFNLNGQSSNQQQTSMQQQRFSGQMNQQQPGGSSAFGQSNEMMASNNRLQQLQHQQSLTGSSQPGGSMMGGQFLAGSQVQQSGSIMQQQQLQSQQQQNLLANNLQQQQMPPNNPFGPQALAHQLSRADSLQMKASVMPQQLAPNVPLQQQQAQLNIQSQQVQQHQPSTTQQSLMGNQGYPMNAVDAMMQQQQQQQQQQIHQSNLQLMAQQQMPLDNQLQQPGQPMTNLNVAAANVNQMDQFLAQQNLGTMYNAQQQMQQPTGSMTIIASDPRQSIRFKQDRSWHQEHAISDQENDFESRVSSRNSRRNNRAGGLRRFDSAAEVLQPHAGGRQLPRPGKLHHMRTSEQSPTGEAAFIERTTPSRKPAVVSKRPSRRTLRHSRTAAEESEESLSFSSGSEISVSSPSARRMASESKRKATRAAASKRAESPAITQATSTKVSNESEKIESAPATISSTSEAKLSEQATQVMEQQQQLIKQSQELIRLQQAQLEQQAETKRSALKVSQVNPNECSASVENGQRLQQSEQTNHMLASNTSLEAKSTPSETKSRDTAGQIHDPIEKERGLGVVPAAAMRAPQATVASKASAATDTSDLMAQTSDSLAGLDEDLHARGSASRNSHLQTCRLHRSDTLDGACRHSDLGANHRVGGCHAHSGSRCSPGKMRSARASELISASLNMNSPTDTTDSDLELLSHSNSLARRAPGTRRRELTPTGGGSRAGTSATTQRTRRQPTGLPPSPLPVVAAIQLHQLKEQHQSRDELAASRGAQTRDVLRQRRRGEFLRSRSVCNSPQHYPSSGATYNSRPGSPDALSVEFGRFQSRKQLPEPPSNAVPLTPSMVRKMIQAQKAAATSTGKLLTSVNAQSTQLTNMHSLRQPCLDRPTASTTSSSYNQVTSRNSPPNRPILERPGAYQRAPFMGNPISTTGSYTAKISGAQVSFADSEDQQSASNRHQALMSAMSRTSDLGKFLDSTYGTSILKQTSRNQQQRPSASPSSHGVGGTSATNDLDRLMGNLDAFYGLDKRPDSLRANVLDALSSSPGSTARDQNYNGAGPLARRCEYAPLSARADSSCLGGPIGGGGGAASRTQPVASTYSAGLPSSCRRRNSEGEGHLTTARYGRPLSSGRHVMFDQSTVGDSRPGGGALDSSDAYAHAPSGAMRASSNYLTPANNREQGRYLSSSLTGNDHRDLATTTTRVSNDYAIDHDYGLGSLSSYRTRDNLALSDVGPPSTYSRLGAANRLRSLGSSMDAGRSLNYANWSPITPTAAENFSQISRPSYFQRPGQRAYSDLHSTQQQQYYDRLSSSPRPAASGHLNYQTRLRNHQLSYSQPRSFDLG